MKKLSFVFSIFILTLIPSVLIYTFFDVYIRLNPFYINIITGGVLFLLGGVLVAKGNTRKNQKEEIDGGTA
ncbi:MAG: hypothetical protein EOM34_17245 [Clostridia bacterium]|nr:hypothetical protein [Clostridia bacterium]